MDFQFDEKLLILDLITKTIHDQYSHQDEENMTS